MTDDNRMYTTKSPWENATPVPGLGASSACGTGAAPAVAAGRQGRPLVIDVHVHMSVPARRQDSGASARTDLLFKSFKAQYDGDGNRHINPKKYSYLPEQIIQRMDEGGVDVSFVMVGGGRRRRPGAPTPDEFGAEQVAKYPGRLVAVSRYDPIEQPWRSPAFVKHIAGLGFRAIKLSSPYDRYEPYDERVWSLYESAIEHDIQIIYHTGWAPLPSMPIKWANIQLAAIDKVGRRYPELKVLLAHAGGPHLWREAVLVAAKHNNFSLDFSSWCTYPPQQLIAMLGLARDVGGIDKVLFGSEHSICDPGMNVGQILNINLWADRMHYERFTDGDIAGILGLNAARKWNLSTELRM